MDETTFNELIIPLSDKTFRLAKSILKDSDQAFDAVQELNLKLWEKGDVLNDVENIPAFVMRCMRNLCLDLLRREHPKEELNNSLGYDAPDPHQEMEKKDIYLHVSAIIDSLPEIQRNVMRLRDVEGLEIHEISDIMGLTNNAVTVNLSRARQRVRNIIIEKTKHEKRNQYITG